MRYRTPTRQAATAARCCKVLFERLVTPVPKRRADMSGNAHSRTRGQARRPSGIGLGLTACDGFSGRVGVASADQHREDVRIGVSARTAIAPCQILTEYDHRPRRC
jgi:hypothetical protein